MVYQSPFEDFTFVEKCKIHNIPLVKYSWGDQCPLCINRDYLSWEGTTEPFIHKDCVSPPIRQNASEFVFMMTSYAQTLQPRNLFHAKVQAANEFVRLMSNETELRRYDDVYSQSPREGYLLLSRKSGKILANITIEKNPNDVKRSFI